ncbi:hypothetical protein Q8W71_21170 [Methylobacterium sp. NEAU 140]|uniref:hypothetical protein n=1 Tax=Methylobacterium sp. NEAU 140 TaxID=3064945 RepID=UPI0027349B88|nr:hypothetical protein [Methylobacterium sp. NEAU 140]MDP4025146.1 hypothetical protein [Methylobacterium sp. NEAU 140]
MSGAVTEEVRRRNAQASADKVLDALGSALRDALDALAESRGDAALDAFLDRRLAMVESLRAARSWEPAALATARARDAAAVEAALRAVVQAVRDDRADARG